MDYTPQTDIETLTDLIEYLTEVADDLFETWSFQPVIWDDGTYWLKYQFTTDVTHLDADDAAGEDAMELLPESVPWDPVQRDTVHELRYHWNDGVVEHVVQDRIVGSNQWTFTISMETDVLAEVEPPVEQIDLFATKDIVE